MPSSCSSGTWCTHNVEVDGVPRLVRTLKTSEAAALLNVSPIRCARGSAVSAIRSPSARRASTACTRTGRWPRCATRCRRGCRSRPRSPVRVRRSRADTHILVGSLNSFELDRADAAMEAALALRSVERSVEEVLLPSLVELGERHGSTRPPGRSRRAGPADWLQRAQRLAPPPDPRGVGRHRRRLAGRPRDRRPRRARPRAVPVARRHAGPDTARSAASAASATCSPPSARTPSSSRAATTPTTTSPAGPTACARWPARFRSPCSTASTRSERVRTTGARLLADSPGEAHRELLAVIESGGRMDATFPCTRPR